MTTSTSSSDDMIWRMEMETAADVVDSGGNGGGNGGGQRGGGIINIMFK
jgi:hypothetical protein